MKSLWDFAWRLTRLSFYFVRILVLVSWSALSAGRATPAERRRRSAKVLRRFFEQLGGTFLKFGQFLAVRPDFVPLEYCEEFAHLFDEVPPFPTLEAIAIMEREFGARVGEVFTDGPAEPVASASFGQVYRLTLRSGTTVAVKVQRPSAAMTVCVDLAIMRIGAFVIDLTTLAFPTRLLPIHREFAKWTREELDYRVEARSAKRIYEGVGQSNLGPNPPQRIPKIYSELTTSRVLTMEFLEGVWMTDILAGETSRREPLAECLERLGTDPTCVARNLLRAFLEQVFVVGVFQADPHPGNILVLEGGAVGMVDFGISGTMPKRLQDHMLTLLGRVVRGDSAGAFRAATDMLEIGPNVDMKGLQAEYEENIEEWLGALADPQTPLSERSFAGLLLRNIQTVRRFGVTFSTGVLRYYRAFVILDAITNQLDPFFNLNDELAEFFKEFQMQRYQDAIRKGNPFVTAFQYHLLFQGLPEMAQKYVADMVASAQRQQPPPTRALWTTDAFRVAAVLAWFGFGIVAVQRFRRGATVYSGIFGPDLSSTEALVALASAGVVFLVGYRWLKATR